MAVVPVDERVYWRPLCGLAWENPLFCMQKAASWAAGLAGRRWLVSKQEGLPPSNRGGSALFRTSINASRALPSKPPGRDAKEVMECQTALLCLLPSPESSR